MSHPAPHPGTPTPPPGPSRKAVGTARDIYAFAIGHRYGRLFLAVARIGLAVALPPLALLLLHIELRNHPLV